MYVVKIISTGKYIPGFSQESVMNGAGISNVVNCPEHAYTAGELEEVQLSPAEVIAMKAEHELDRDLANPIRKWNRDIKATDSTIPRWFEDYVTENSIVLAPGRAKDNYDAKVALRAGRPV